MDSDTMDSETEVIPKIPTTDKIDPTGFDVTICALLTGLGAEKYVDIFRKHNVGQITLVEFSDEDLVKLGVTESKIRHKILQEVKNLPVYAETQAELNIYTNPKLGPLEILEMLEETSQHLYRIYLSMLANNLAVKKTKNITDPLLFEDKYASDIGLSTLNELSNIINSMEVTMHVKLKDLVSEPRGTNYRKVVVCSLGSVTIAVLAVLFVKSLKHIK